MGKKIIEKKATFGFKWENVDSVFCKKDKVTGDITGFKCMLQGEEFKDVVKDLEAVELNCEDIVKRSRTTPFSAWCQSQLGKKFTCTLSGGILTCE